MKLKKCNTKNIRKSKNINSFNDKTIYRITIRKVTKEEKQQEKDSEGISFVGGPIVAVIEDIRVKVNENNKVKFENLGQLGNSKVFLNNKYLKKYSSLDNSHIKKIAYAYDKNLTNSAFAVNTITNILRNYKKMKLNNIIILYYLLIMLYKRKY